jgi:hypothetical protein
MSQPPYPPPPGAGEPGSDRPGPDDRTRRIAPPGEGQRDETRQFAPPGQPPSQGFGQQPSGATGAPGQYPPGGQYPQPGPYGAPWAPPGGEPPESNRNTVTALVVAAVVVLAAVGVALHLLLGRDDATLAGAADHDVHDRPGVLGQPGSSAEETTEATPSTEATTEAGGLPPPTVTPEGVGDDPTLDLLAIQCFAGDMQACDDLYNTSDAGSDY